MTSSERSEILLIERQDSLLKLGLNRPEKRNAVSDELLLSVEAAFDAWDDEIRCVILHGIGKDFSAGLDLSELGERDVVAGLYHSRMWHRVLDKIQFASVPVLAILQGAVIGGGLELAAACHIRIAERSTFYALPEGQRGIYVGGGASIRVPRLIGQARMMDMMLTGRVYRAEEGERIGLAQYLVDEGEGMSKAIELAARIVSNAPMTHYALIQVLPRIVEADHTQASLLESLMAAIAQDAPEAKQRMRDFLEGKAGKVVR